MNSKPNTAANALRLIESAIDTDACLITLNYILPVRAVGRITFPPKEMLFQPSGQVAVGDFSPTAPTDPDVRTLPHLMWSTT